MSISQPIDPLEILISAYACRPNMGSEPGVGWNIVKNLAQYHQLRVLTRRDNQSEIEAELGKYGISNLDFIYCDLPKWASWLPSAQLPHYYLWQVTAYFVARKMLKSRPCDLIHHVTYVRYSTPSFLALLPYPFIWGPVGGAEQTPATFWKSFGWKGKLYEILRTISHRFGEYDPFTRITAKQSLVVQATTNDTALRLQKLGAKEIETSSALGLSQLEIDTLSQLSTPEPAPVRFISIARLLHWKGIHLGIQAFAQISQQLECEYWVIGEGPELQRLKALAQQLNVANQIKFFGELSRQETLQHLAESHILVHPSLHDSGGFVFIEAMASGRPVICLNLGGAAVHVSPETGILVSAQNPQQVQKDLAQAMIMLATNKELRNSMGKAGKQRVRSYFTWEAKCRKLAKLYEYHASCQNTTPAGSH